MTDHATRRGDCRRTEDVIAQDLRDLNRRYFYLAREVARHDPEVALRVFGLPTEVQEKLTGMSLETIDEMLAHPHTLHFVLRLPDSFWARVAEVKAADLGAQAALRILSLAQSLSEVAR